MRYQVNSFEESARKVSYIVLAEPLEVQWQEDNYHGQARIRIVDVLHVRRDSFHRALDPAIAPGQIVTLAFSTARPNVEALQGQWLALISSPLATEGLFRCDRDHPFKPAVLAATLPALLTGSPD